MTDTPDRRLIELRDWARSRADWQAGKPRVACSNQTPFGRPKKPDHANCGGDNCGCECHAPTDRDRELWARISDEIDAYLKPTIGEALF